MIHEAYMPVYMGSRFSLHRTGGSTRGSTRGPRGPKNPELKKAELKPLIVRNIPCNPFLQIIGLEHTLIGLQPPLPSNGDPSVPPLFF